MRVLHRLAANRKIRFGIVGIGNTLLNFVVLNIAFFTFHLDKVVASVIATLCAVTVSFFLNRNFVFRHHDRSIRQPLMFALVTITGVLAVQNLVYSLFVVLLKDNTYVIAQAAHSIIGLNLSSDFLDINVSNFGASLVAMVWNYNGYRLFVFKRSKQEDTVAEDEVITLPA